MTTTQPAIKTAANPAHAAWIRPTTVVLARSFFMLVAQGLVAAIYLARGHPSPWNAAAPWWTVYATLVDLGCLALLITFTRAEGIRLRDLIGKIQLRRGQDIFLGLGCLAVMVFMFSLPGWVANRLGFEVSKIMYPGLFWQRHLPTWAVIYSFSLFWLIWSPTEEMTYNGYALPRLRSLLGHKWVALLIVGFWWALQHSFLPFIPDWKYVLWRFLFFLPGVIVMMLLYLSMRRLAPLILAHWVMDCSAVFYTLSF